MSGDTWVLIRGLARERRHWGEFVDAMGAAMPASRLVCIDLPGNGEHRLERSPTTIVAMAEHARRTLRERDIAPPYRLIALSMGAMVGTAWARAHPAEIVSAVLINTSMRPFSPFWQRLKPRRYAMLVRWTIAALLAERDGGRIERDILRATSRLRRGDAAVVAAWLDIRADRPVGTRNAAAQLVAAARFHAPAVSPFADVLLLCSARDGLVDPRCSLAIATAWGCTLATHPSAGHDLTLDDPQWAARTIVAWRDSMLLHRGEFTGPSSGCHRDITRRLEDPSS